MLLLDHEAPHQVAPVMAFRAPCRAATRALRAAGIDAQSFRSDVAGDVDLLRRLAGTTFVPRRTPACWREPVSLTFFDGFPRAEAPPYFAQHCRYIAHIHEPLEIFAGAAWREQRPVATYDSEVDFVLARARRDGAIIAIIDSDTTRHVRALHFAPSVVDAINFAALGVYDLPADEVVADMCDTDSRGRVLRREFHDALYEDPEIRFRDWMRFYAHGAQTSVRRREFPERIAFGRAWHLM